MVFILTYNSRSVDPDPLEKVTLREVDFYYKKNIVIDVVATECL